MTYRGKYPSRIRSVSTSKGRTTIETNNGRFFLLRPRCGDYPRVGQDLWTIPTDNLIPMRPWHLTEEEMEVIRRFRARAEEARGEGLTCIYHDGCRHTTECTQYGSCQAPNLEQAKEGEPDA